MMIFMVLVGGLGTFEGPVIGAAILFALQTQFGNGGVWYFVGLGTSAILFALFLPRGIWGTIADHFDLKLAPIGYWVRGAPSSDASPPSGGSDDRQERPDEVVT